MKIYKNYLRKLEPAYATQLYNTKHSGLSESASFNQLLIDKDSKYLHVSTQLPHSFLHHLLILLLALSAIMLISQLQSSLALKVICSLIVVLLTAVNSLRLRKNRQSLHSLQCIDHVWILKYSEGTTEKLDLLSISHGLGVMFFFRFKIFDENKEIKICIWKHQSPSTFLTYCYQLLLIGKKPNIN